MAESLPDITLRPITPADLPFLERLYGTTREEELALVGWDEAIKRAFIHMQFAAQHRHYQEHYPGAALDLILSEDEPIGRRYLWCTGDEVRVMDIALMPGYRGLGLGTRLLGDVLREAAANGKRVSLHVEAYNPAMRLYERLEFVESGESGIYRLMVWSPPTSGGPK